MKLTAKLLGALACFWGHSFSLLANTLSGSSGTGDFGGWNVLQPPLFGDPVDGLLLEWDYFTVNCMNEDDEEDRCSCVFGYMVADPFGYKADEGVPSGGNVLVSCQFAGGERVAFFELFGLNGGTSISDIERSFRASNQENGNFAELRPNQERDALIASGEVNTIRWELKIEPDENSAPFAPITSTDLGFDPPEMWTLNARWPLTKVTGTIEDISSQKTYSIDCHGYRENNWGRWAFIYGGWDFSVLFDKKSRVFFLMQSYYSLPRLDPETGAVLLDKPSTAFDFMDVAFPCCDSEDSEEQESSEDDCDTQCSLRFTNITWTHQDFWESSDRWDCRPLATSATATDGEYALEVIWDINEKQVEVSSDANALLSAYVIQEHYPSFQGTISKGRGEVIARFSGEGNGEFSSLRDLSSLQILGIGTCEAFGDFLFTR